MDLKSLILRTMLACIVALSAASVAAGQGESDFSLDRSPLPQATEPVNDLAGLLSAQTVAELNRKIKDFKAQTDPPVVLAVAIVRTTGDRDIFDYSLAVARGWKVGTDRDDNPSALLFIAIDDRKYVTQVSRDLEDELPDGLAGQLQRRHLVPAFKRGDYDKGVRDTVDAYIATIGGKTGRTDGTAPMIGARSENPEGIGFSEICGLIIAMVVFFSLFAGKRRGAFFFIGGSGGGWSGGGGGGGDWGGFSGGDFGGGGAGGDW